MSAIEPVMPRQSLKRQIPAFAAIGAFGYVVDSTCTVFFVGVAHLDPLIARLPAFAIATIINFLLNRWFTFTGSRAPLMGAFARYCMVSGAGLAVNYAAYALALHVAAGLLGGPTGVETLPVFIAFGAGIAMFVTFFGFKFFAFRA